jgi:hypothetical protein
MISRAMARIAGRAKSISTLVTIGGMAFLKFGRKKCQTPSDGFRHGAGATGYSELILWLVVLLRDSITLPEGEAAKCKQGDDQDLYCNGQHGKHGRHGAELDGTGTDDCCCKEWDEHGFPFGCVER